MAIFVYLIAFFISYLTVSRASKSKPLKVLLVFNTCDCHTVRHFSSHLKFKESNLSFLFLNDDYQYTDCHSCNDIDVSNIVESTSYLKTINKNVIY